VRVALRVDMLQQGHHRAQAVTPGRLKQALGVHRAQTVLLVTILPQQPLSVQAARLVAINQIQFLHLVSRAPVDRTAQQLVSLQ